MKVQIKNMFTGKVQFECELENDYGSHYRNLGEAVKIAAKKGINLRGANLRNAELRYIDLSGVDLTNVNLCGADLYFANLEKTNMKGANLYKADLRYAIIRDTKLRSANLCDTDLRGAFIHKADLHCADFRGADFRLANIKNAGLVILQLPKWTCYIQKEHIRIGCQHHTAEYWFKLDDWGIADMSLHGLAWSKQWKPVIQAAHEQLVKGVK